MSAYGGSSHLAHGMCLGTVEYTAELPPPGGKLE